MRCLNLNLYLVADCSTPSMLTNGMDDTSRGTTYQSVAIYTCDAGYRINGDVLVACEASETWSTPTSQPMCTGNDSLSPLPLHL